MFFSPFNVYYNLRVKSEADKVAKEQNETIFKNAKSAMVKSYMFGASRAHEYSIEYDNNENENEGFIFMSTNRDSIKKHLYESSKFKKLYGANLDYVYTDPGLKKEDRVSLRSSNFSKILKEINKDEYQEFYTDNADKITYRRNKPEKSEYFLKKDIYGGLEKKLGIDSEEKLEKFIFGSKPKVEKPPVEERRILRAKPKPKAKDILQPENINIYTGPIIEEITNDININDKDDFDLQLKIYEKETIATTLPQVPSIFNPTSEKTESKLDTNIKIDDLLPKKYKNPLDEELANINIENSPFTFAESSSDPNKERELLERENEQKRLLKEFPELDPGNQLEEKLSKDDLK